MENFFNYHKLLQLIWKWKMQLIIVAIAAAVLSVFFSSKLFITPLFKSTGIVYPANVKPYSDESETEQLLQLINSRDIRDSIIKKYSLGSHYKLDPNDKYYQSTLLYLYGQRVNIKKTEFESVVIEVADSDPKQASDMVNDIIALYDGKVRELQKSKFREVVTSCKIWVDLKQKQLDSLQREIDAVSLGKAGIEELSPEKMPLTQQKEFMGPEKDKLVRSAATRKGHSGSNGRLVMLLNLAQTEALAYSEFKLKYDQALLDYNREYTYTNVVSRPFPADKKSSPVTWLIVVLSTITALMAAIFVIAVIENRKQSGSPVA
jgi:capsular polysaccharide biosynthesis protein